MEREETTADKKASHGLQTTTYNLELGHVSTGRLSPSSLLWPAKHAVLSTLN